MMLVKPNLLEIMKDKRVEHIVGTNGKNKHPVRIIPDDDVLRSILQLYTSPRMLDGQVSGPKPLPL